MATPKYEILIDDAQRHALVTAANFFRAMAAEHPSPDSDMVERMIELSGMLSDCEPGGTLNDFTA